MTQNSNDPNAFRDGAAYIDGKFMPVGEARIPITCWGYRRSDVTYDVVGVWGGSFFRLDDHIERFRASMTALRLGPVETDDDIRRILIECVQRSGLREAYVAMDCLRGRPPAGKPFHPAHSRNYLTAFAIPWVWVMPLDMQQRGAHMIIADVQRISDASIDPTVKNFHWGDLTRGLFEAHDQGADTCVLLDANGFVTEGPGFNVFSVTNGKVATPDRGALGGITRRTVIELCNEVGIAIEVRPITAAEFRAADEIFVSTTAGGVMPVSRIDGRPMNGDRPGPVSAQIRERYWGRRAEGWHATPVDYPASMPVAGPAAPMSGVSAG